ncbi:MAG: GNAT family N-acetyltransferase [Terriglobales bacterium]
MNLRDMVAIPGVELLSLDRDTDVRRWNALVDAAPVPDVYFRPGYLRACQAAGHGCGGALLIASGATRVLLPLLFRDLRLGFEHAVAGCDALTPYGYGGLLPLTPSTLSHDSVVSTLALFRRWCAENRVVSCLVRLHPLLDQGNAFEGLDGPALELRRFGPTVALDLTHWDWDADCLSGMTKGRRSDLSVARKQLQLTWASEGHNPSGKELRARDCLQVFRDLYEQRMEELHASEFYHFPPQYYSALVSGLGDQLGISLAWLDDRAVGAAIFMFDRHFAHYHLSATDHSGRAAKATTLMIHAAASRARACGCTTLHLGGGAPGSGKLFEFKRSFGGRVHTYSFVTIIADRERYDALVRQRVSHPNLPPPRPNFFPLYRA